MPITEISIAIVTPKISAELITIIGIVIMQSKLVTAVKEIDNATFIPEIGETLSNLGHDVELLSDHHEKNSISYNFKQKSIFGNSKFNLIKLSFKLSFNLS